MFVIFAFLFLLLGLLHFFLCLHFVLFLSFCCPQCLSSLPFCFSFWDFFTSSFAFTLCFSCLFVVHNVCHLCLFVSPSGTSSLLPLPSLCAFLVFLLSTMFVIFAFLFLLLGLLHFFLCLHFVL